MSPLRIGYESAKANLVPMVVLWFAAAATAVCYYVVPGFAALLEPLADMAIKAGEIIVAEGIAVEAARAALSSFAGYGAIVAGALLIAAGTAAKAGLAALAKGGSTSATTASNYGGNGSGGTTTQNIETELTITVEGRISGSDIVLAGQKTLDSWNR